MTDTVELREALLAQDYERILAATAALAGDGDEAPPASTDLPARLFRGLALTLTGAPSAGLPLLTRAREKLSPAAAQRTGCLSDLGLAHLLCGGADTAIDCFERHLAASPDDAVTYGRLAAAYLAADDAERALEYYVEATRREPGRAEWHSNLAAVQLRLQRLDDALENYTIALDLNPDLAQAQAARERVLVALGQIDVVVDELAARLAEDSRNAPLRFRCARALVQANRLPEALNTLLEVRLPVEELIDETPDDAEADAAPELAAREELPATAEPVPDAAAAMITSAIPDADDDEDIASLRNQTLLRALLAEVFAERAMFPRAVLALDEILRLQPPNPIPYIAQKAGALTELGRYEAAEALLDEAEEEHGDAWAVMATIKTALGGVLPAGDPPNAAGMRDPGHPRLRNAQNALVVTGTTTERWWDGFDAANLGSAGIAGRNSLTLATGIRFPITPKISLGVAYEFPIAGKKYLFKQRVTTAFSWEL